ncbi:hypothetical protein SF1_42400 [Sphingobacterium faecium NBRC 15299]|uniref:DUF488 domain-containing protein n=1 Tax=Sphingobacterium faecium TaxID=34087 RepID=UPI000D3CD47C|nr:DUF488 domain-containing protein [Sphingobacterium faecium]PTX10184.1 uncharacterized protein (DUF488 family) [Sphingobacterium faecium]GEM66258.1 hypothetical protein SF1_42400 [Sphingobacterium faecium NBRC 15299]
MFYRRKVILALIQSFGGKLEKLNLQKLLFLFTDKQIKPEYDFIPYKYGCYSFSAKADLNTMVTKGQLEEGEFVYLKLDTADYIKTLKEADRKILLYIKNLFGNFNGDRLMKHTYVNYPYYAINSIVAKDILTDEQFDKVSFQKPCSNETMLFTIGYEGISLEEYLNRLVKNNVQLLIDVRRNPLSMKFGFSKSQLIKYCNSVGIKYIHIPEVGIQSDLRQELKTQSDYDKLFEYYKKEELTKSLKSQENILSLLIENKRIALTCFEKDICQCHRKHLAEAICRLPNFDYKLKHI